MPIVYPPTEVFEVDPTSMPTSTFDRVAAKGTGIGGWEKTICPDTGGMFMYDSSLLQPIKGHPYPEAIEANNMVKRIILMAFVPLASKWMFPELVAFALKPWKWKIKSFERWFDQYFRLVNEVYRTPTCHFLKPKFYCNFSQELWKFSEKFLTYLGVEQSRANLVGKIIATLFQYDDAYRYPLEDIFSETTQELMLKQPQKELKKIMNLLTKRFDVEGGHVVAEKFVSAGKLVSMILWLPKIRKAFIQAMSEIDFRQLQLDEIDYYHVLYRRDYKFLGRELEDRLEERRKIEITSRIAIANN